MIARSVFNMYIYICIDCSGEFQILIYRVLYGQSFPQSCELRTFHTHLFRFIWPGSRAANEPRKSEFGLGIFVSK